MVTARMIHWIPLGMALLLCWSYTAGQAQTVAALQEKNRQLEAELHRLQAEYGQVFTLSGTAKKELLAMAAVLSANPGLAFDFSAPSGEMCFAPGHGNMIHYAVEPGKTTEDVLYMLHAQPFIDRGLQVAKLPTLPTETGKMRPFQWYYYDGTTLEPHHGRKLHQPYLMMSVNVR